MSMFEMNTSHELNHVLQCAKSFMTHEVSRFPTEWTMFHIKSKASKPVLTPQQLLRSSWDGLSDSSSVIRSGAEDPVNACQIIYLKIQGMKGKGYWSIFPRIRYLSPGTESRRAPDPYLKDFNPGPLTSGLALTFTPVNCSGRSAMEMLFSPAALQDSAALSSHPD